jgi:DnaJ like chaperone protein
MISFLQKIIVTLILVPALWWAGGLLGLGLGLLLGGAIDFLRSLGKAEPKEVKKKVRSSVLTDFVISTLLLSAAVIKADGDMDELELGYLRRFLAEQFGEKRAMEYMAIFRSSYAGEFDVEKTARNIQQTTSYETRLQLLYIMVGIAKSNFDVEERERTLIDNIVVWLAIEKADYESVRSMFSTEMDAYYRILEVTPSASDRDIKTAYKTIAAKFHPDKVAHLGEEITTTATRKFQKLQEAYTAIRQARGF